MAATALSTFSTWSGRGTRPYLRIGNLNQQCRKRKLKSSKCKTAPFGGKLSRRQSLFLDLQPFLLLNCNHLTKYKFSMRSELVDVLLHVKITTPSVSANDAISYLDIMHDAHVQESYIPVASSPSLKGAPSLASRLLSELSAPLHSPPVPTLPCHRDPERIQFDSRSITCMFLIPTFALISGIALWMISAFLLSPWTSCCS